MNITFKKTWLEELANDPDARTALSDAIVRAYRERVTQIVDAVDERVLRSIKSAHFEKLKREFKGKYSMRLVGGWRIIFEIIPGTPKNTIHVVDVVDYH